MPRSAIIHSSDRGRADGLRAMRPRLSVASRRLRPAGGRRAVGRGRCLLGAGGALRHRLCATVSPGSHPRHDVSLAHARRTGWNCREPSSATSMSPTARCTIWPRATGCRLSSIIGSATSRRKAHPDRPWNFARRSKSSTSPQGWIGRFEDQQARLRSFGATARQPSLASRAKAEAGLPSRSSQPKPAFAQMGFGAAAFTRFASEGWWSRGDLNP